DNLDVKLQASYRAQRSKMRRDRSPMPQASSSRCLACTFDDLAPMILSRRSRFADRARHKLPSISWVFLCRLEQIQRPTSRRFRFGLVRERVYTARLLLRRLDEARLAARS